MQSELRYRILKSRFKSFESRLDVSLQWIYFDITHLLRDADLRAKKVTVTYKKLT